MPHIALFNPVKQTLQEFPSENLQAIFLNSPLRMITLYEVSLCTVFTYAANEWFRQAAALTALEKSERNWSILKDVPAGGKIYINLSHLRKVVLGKEKFTDTPHLDEITLTFPLLTLKIDAKHVPDPTQAFKELSEAFASYQKSPHSYPHCSAPQNAHLPKHSPDTNLRPFSSENNSYKT